MTVVGIASPPGRHHASGLHAQLAALVRPEFREPIIPLDVDHPVFARGRCEVSGCRRGAWSRLLCSAHYTRWRNHGRPELEQFRATTGPVRLQTGTIDAFDLRRLNDTTRLEVAYVIQCYHDDRTVRLLPTMISGLVQLLVAAKVGSLLDRPLPDWRADTAATRRVDVSRLNGILRYAIEHLTDLVEGADAEAEFTRDLWRAQILGIPTLKGTHQIRFDGISQVWLRETVKRWARFRLAGGKKFSSVDIDVRSVRWFSRFLAEQHPRIVAPAGLTREVIEHYLSWFLGVGLAGHTSNTHLMALRGFLEACRRYGWMPGLPTTATIYIDELPRRPQPLPRFVPEFIMAQLENPQHLARLPDDDTRHLLLVIIETGLRASDACTLPFNPIIEDSVGWPCLKFFNHKMSAEQLVPLSQTAADAIRNQQTHLRTRWPHEPPARLFPSPHCNPDGARPVSAGTFRIRLNRWQADIGLHDETGQAVQVTPHQFRHTLGTRLINQNVPQHVVQKLLGHASPQMTARYATIHDATVRAAFDDYQQRRVDVHGHRLDFDPDAAPADAEWVKHNLARVAASLPNGYCGRPPQQDCPHPNACLTCPDFQTTPQFLPLHRRQRDDTLVLVVAAEQAGNTRLADNHRQVAVNLEHVITTLETIDQENTDAR